MNNSKGEIPVVPKTVQDKKAGRKRMVWALVLAIFASFISYIVLRRGGATLTRAGNVTITAQLSDPWKYLQVDRSKAFGLLFSSPVLTVQEIRATGARPSQEIFENNQRIWLFDFVGQTESGAKERFRLRLIFEDNKLRRIDCPFSIGLLISDSALIQYSFALGHSSIDYVRRRSVVDPSIPLPFPAVAMPTKLECNRMFGAPMSSSMDAGLETQLYRYDQILEPKSRALKFEASLTFSKPLGAFRSGALALAGYLIVFTETEIYIQK